MSIATSLRERFYTERVEDLCTRVLYFANTLDSYVLIAAVLSLLIVDGTGWLRPALIPAVAGIYLCFKIADFYPLFLLFTPVFAGCLAMISGVSGVLCARLLAANVVLFVGIQFAFMGIPDSIVARDPRVPIRKLYNSLFTIAPTTVSALMSIYFGTLCAVVLLVQPNPLRDPWAAVLWISLYAAALVTRRFLPRPFASARHLPTPAAALVDRVLVLNIDGCRLDRFYEANLPLTRRLRASATYFERGATTVYRALTNPAFVSILTGTTPDVHGVRDNNLGRRIRVEGLPDVVPTILYGSMHVKHFSKPQWTTKIVSLPTYGIYRSDDVMLESLKQDLVSRRDVRLFVADLSEVDFLGHAYGSESRQYLDAIGRAGERIEHLLDWLEQQNTAPSTAVIISSDHGMVAIDHSYLLFDAEKYVPLFFCGDRIQKGRRLDFPTSIMDITPTISFLLGVRYPASCQGRVIAEALAVPESIEHTRSRAAGR